MHMQEEFMDYQALVARLKENDEISRKFFEIQTAVLATLNFDDFFSKLLGTVQEKFGVPHIWLSLIYPSKVATLVHRLAHTGSVKRLSRDELNGVIGGGMIPILMNTALERVSCILPDGGCEFCSIAITPIIFDGDLIGSFNLADPSPDRFHPGLDPAFLSQLGLVVSICLSNVVAHEELQILASKDPLTGLLNRRAMEQVLKSELARAKRYGTPLSLVFVDVDDFKSINDRFGHDRGDELLVGMASLFTELSRKSDIVARFAGDEFILILPGVDTKDATGFMERLKHQFLARPFTMEGTEVAVRFSYGVASSLEIGDAGEFLRKADTELYASKRTKTSHK
jgi:diguanylate cyclase (GGDEF)-like protein